MALIKCPKCGKEFSDRAQACPQCGTSKEEVQRLIKEQAEKAAEQERIRKEREAEERKKYIKFAIALVIVFFTLFSGYVVYINTMPISARNGKELQSALQNPLRFSKDSFKVRIPRGVTSIEGSAFDGWSSITSVTIPNSVTSIESSAFCGCTGLTSVTIPNSVTSIGGWAFISCISLTTIEIPNSVTSIGDWAFANCKSLTSITIPSSVTCIWDDAFEGCTSLNSIKVENGNIIYDSRNNCNAIIETASNSLILGCQNTIIPNSVTSIGNNAFTKCDYLTSVTIPNSVTSIGESAFDGCSGMTTIEIPNSVTSIGDWAFRWCSDLTSLIFGNSVTYIGKSAFCGCRKIVSITCKAITPPTCGSEAFDKISTSIPVYVPAESVNAYKNATEWKKFTKIQAIPE